MIGALLCCNMVISPVYASTFQPVNTFTPTIAGSPTLQDSFGQTVYTHEDYIFIAAPVARPNPDKVASGAIYVYKKSGSSWNNIQVITTGGMSDHLGVLNVRAIDDWLFVSAIGTPIGGAGDDGMLDQDFTGSVRIYQKNTNGTYDFVQAIDKTTPGLEGLSVVDIDAHTQNTPPKDHELGAAFGINFDLNEDGTKLLVSAPTQKSAAGDINAGAVFAFELENNQWVLKQTIYDPEGSVKNGTFGGRIKVSGDLAIISNTETFSNIKLSVNSKVFLYRFDCETQSWHHMDTVHGTQENLMPAASFLYGGVVFDSSGIPQPGSVQVGDNFGGSLALKNRWLMVGAPYENLGTDKPRGAAYLYHIETFAGQPKMVFVQKITSSDPESLLTGVNVAIDGKTALVADPARTGTSGQIAQGAAIVYERHGAQWGKTAELVDPNGQAYQFFANGLDVKGKRILTGTGTAITAINLGLVFSPAFLPQMPLPLQSNKAIEWERQ